MVWDYLNVTNNPETSREFIADVIWQLDDEFIFWMNRTVNVPINNKMYKLARYRVEVDGPRPESYEEDHSLARKLAEGERKEWYTHMKSGAESGWDYSSRWFATKQGRSAEDELLDVETGNIIPVDLNAFLCKNAEIMENLFLQVGKPEKAAEYRTR
jgi:alpha,alpha-trehalase